MTHCKNFPSIFGAALLLLFPAGPIGRAAGAGSIDDFHPSAVSRLFKISTVAQQPCLDCKFGREYVLETTNLKNGKKDNYFSRTGFESIDSLAFVSDSRVVILGKFNSAIDAVEIADLFTLRTVDSLFCYSPTISPTGKFVIYVKFFQPHFMPSWVYSDVYLVYDLSKSASRNALNLPGALDGQREKGFPVYPVENSRRKSYAPLVQHTDDVEGHTNVSAFTWISPSRVQFVDYYRGSRSLVTIDLSNGPEHPITTAKVIVRHSHAYVLL